MENVPGPQSKAQQLPIDITLLTHCLYSYGLRPGLREVTTLNYPGTIQGQTRVTMKTGLITQMLLPCLRRALALSQLTPAENMSIALKEPPPLTPR